MAERIEIESCLRELLRPEVKLNYGLKRRSTKGRQAAALIGHSHPS